jgi:hypothetical protein
MLGFWHRAPPWITYPHAQFWVAIVNARGEAVAPHYLVLTLTRPVRGEQLLLTRSMPQAAVGSHHAPELLMPLYEPLELTPLRVEQDRSDFEGWNLLDHLPVLLVRRSSAAGR